MQRYPLHFHEHREKVKETLRGKQGGGRHHIGNSRRAKSLVLRDERMEGKEEEAI